MAEKLSITIFLDGAAEIERQLEGIGAAGTKAFDAIGTAAEKVGGFDKLDPKDVTKKLEQFGVKGKAAIDKITAAVAQAGRLERIVRGVADVEQGFAKLSVAASAMSTRVTTAVTAVGTAMSAAVGPITRVARSFGLIGRLGAGGAIVGLGAAVVGMEKTADAARVLEANLQALFRNARLGTAFFNQIQSAAQTAGSSLQSTADTMFGIVKTMQQALKAKGVSFAPDSLGFKQVTDDAEKFFDTLQKGMKLSGATSAEANKAIAALFNEIKTKGVLTGDALRQLAAQFPQLANELVKFLGTPGQSMEQLADQVDRGLKKIDITKFINALKRADPQIQKLFTAFDPTLAQRMDTISGAWDRLLNSFGKSPAGAGIKAAMDDIATGLDEIAKKQEQVGRFTVDKPPETTTGKFFDQMFQEWNQNIEIAKENWQRLVALVTSPLKIIELQIKMTPLGPLFDPILKLIDVVKEKFKLMFTVEPDIAAEPAWVQKYLGFIERIKNALKAAVTSSPEQGGQLGGQGVPFLGGQIPADVVARGAARIEDRRGEGLDTTAINTALTELATAAEGATQSLQGLQGLEFSSIGTAVDSLNAAISSLAASMQSLTFSGLSEAFAQATAAAQQLATDLQNMGLSEVAGAMQQVVLAANSAAQALSSIQVGGDGGGGFAAGGQVFGRPGRDKVPAYLTRNEWVMRAAAVRKYGIAFMRAINEGRFRIPKFDLGGLVPGPISAFANGGLAMRGSGRPIALTINAGGGERQTFHLWADEQVADSVLRYATKRQVASAGRKSGAFG